MPPRTSRRPADLERVARVLGPGSAGWVPQEPERPPEGAGRRSPSTAGRVRAGPVRVVAERLRDGVGLARARGVSGEPDEVARVDADLRRARRPGLLTLPDELRGGRQGVSSAAVVALLALAVAVGCLFVVRVLWAERSVEGSDVAPGPVRSVRVVQPSTTAGAAGAAGVAGAGGATGMAGPTGRATGGATGALVVVHVVGQVVRPGLVRLAAGARVADAIAGAGGTRPGADVSAVNLARPVVDGEQVRVPRTGEVLAPVQGPAPSAGSGSSAGPVSLNAADAVALDALPGVGPVLAQRILDWRAEHGRFTSVDELGEVSGIGDKLMAQLRDRVTL